jgi:hypothetical protein
MAKALDRRLTLGELQFIDAQISLAQERGLKPDEHLRANSDLSCCGAIAAEAKGKLTISANDRLILRQMAQLQSKLQPMPTLRELTEIRGELLREAKTRK